MKRYHSLRKIWKAHVTNLYTIEVRNYIIV